MQDLPGTAMSDDTHDDGVVLQASKTDCYVEVSQVQKGRQNAHSNFLNKLLKLWHAQCSNYCCPYTLQYQGQLPRAATSCVVAVFSTLSSIFFCVADQSGSTLHSTA